MFLPYEQERNTLNAVFILDQVVVSLPLHVVIRVGFCCLTRPAKLQEDITDRLFSVVTIQSDFERIIQWIACQRRYPLPLRQPPGPSQVGLI
jgi:hypothetical protein